MSRRHYNLPSLNALAAFESAARHLSLTRAAGELNVTPGAVSKQVKSLEDELGVTLFRRLHRALELTQQGESVARAMRDTLERLSLNLQSVRAEGAVRSVSIGTTHAFAQLWLMPRLGSFWTAHQDIVVDHIISDRSQDLHRPDVDLRIRYGHGDWADEEAVKLFDDEITAVASPSFIKHHKIRTIREAAALPLLSVENVDWTWTTWPEFLAALDIPARRLKIRRFNSYVIALQAAQTGQGASLGWMRLLRPLIKQKRLAQIGKEQIKAPQSYYVAWSRKRPLSREAEILRDWLLSEAE